MNSRPWIILLVEDDEDDYIIIHDLLLAAGLPNQQILWAPTYSAGLRMVAEQPVDAVLIDYYLGGQTGADFIREALANGCDEPFILLTGTSSISIDLEGMSAGAADYLEKDNLTTSMLERTLRYAIERYRLQAEVKQQGELLRSIYEIDPGALAIVAGQNLTFRYVNPAYQTILPHPDQNPVGREYTQVWETDDRPQELAAIRAAFEGKVIDIDRVPHPLPDGDRRFYSSRLRRIDWNGEPAVLISLWDVTSIENANQRAELAAEEAENRAREAEAGKRILEAVMTYIPEGVAVADVSDERLSMVSRYGLEKVNAQLLATGNGAHNVQPGAGYFYHLDGTTPAAVDELPLERAMRRGEVVDGEEWILRSPGRQNVFIECNAGPIYDHRGQISGGVIAWRDISERIRADQALKDAYEAIQDSHNRFRVALQNSPVSVYTHDRDLRYTWIYHPHHGWSSEDVLGRRDDELYPPETAKCMMGIKQKVLINGTGVREELMFTIQGEERFYDLTVEPLIDTNRQVVGLTVSSTDVTDRRRIEAEQQASSTMLEVQRLLGQHREQERLQIARDLHDGPLQGLIGVTYGLVEAMEISDKAARLTKLTDIRNRLQQEIRDMRAFCSELRPPALAPFGVEKAIRSHVDTILERNPELMIHLDLTPDGQTVPEETRMTIFRIYQEVMNNILRHSHAKEVSISQWLEDGAVLLDVQDDGVGFIVPEQWVEFARHGHLGLVGLRERAEAAGGRVMIQSSPGHGTKIGVSVPFHTGQLH